MLWGTLANLVKSVENACQFSKKLINRWKNVKNGKFLKEKEMEKLNFLKKEGEDHSISIREKSIVKFYFLMGLIWKIIFFFGFCNINHLNGGEKTKTGIIVREKSTSGL